MNLDLGIYYNPYHIYEYGIILVPVNTIDLDYVPVRGVGGGRPGGVQVQYDTSEYRNA